MKNTRPGTHTHTHTSEMTNGISKWGRTFVFFSNAKEALGRKSITFIKIHLLCFVQSLPSDRECTTVLTRHRWTKSIGITQQALRNNAVTNRFKWLHLPSTNSKRKRKRKKKTTALHLLMNLSDAVNPSTRCQRRTTGDVFLKVPTNSRALGQQTPGKATLSTKAAVIHGIIINHDFHKQKLLYLA